MSSRPRPRPAAWITLLATVLMVALGAGVVASAATSPSTTADTSTSSSSSTESTVSTTTSTSAESTTTTTAPDTEAETNVVPAVDESDLDAEVADPAARADVVLLAASEISGAITSIGVRDTEIYGYSTMTLDLTWAVPDSAQSDDFFTLQLPPELVAATSGFALNAPGTTTAVANATVDANGLVTFTLTDYVDQNNNVQGTAFFQAGLRDQGLLGEIPLAFVASGTTFRDTVTVRPGVGANREDARKYGAWTDIADQGVRVPAGALTWRVESSVGQFPAGVQFVDTVAADDGWRIDCASLQVREYLARNLQANGDTFGQPSATLTPNTHYTVTCSPTGFTINVTRVSAEPALFQVRYSGSLIDGATQRSYENAVKVTAGSRTWDLNDAEARTNAGGDGTGDTTTTTTTTTTTVPATTTTAAPTTVAPAPSTTALSADEPTTTITTTTVAAAGPTTTVVAGTLPTTGGSPVGPALLAALAVGLGLILVTASRRRAAQNA